MFCPSFCCFLLAGFLRGNFLTALRRAHGWPTSCVSRGYSVRPVCVFVFPLHNETFFFPGNYRFTCNSFCNVYLCIWLGWVLVVAHGIWFPDQGWNPGPLRWKPGALATGPPGKSFPCSFKTQTETCLRQILCTLSPAPPHPTNGDFLQNYRTHRELSISYNNL